MGIFSGIGKLKDKTVSVSKSLVGYDQITKGTKENYDVFKNLVQYNLTKNTDTEPEIYMPKEKVIETEKSFKKLVIIFLCLFIMGLLYSIGNLFLHNWSLALVAFAFTALCLSITFRYHFWLYQIRNRILGASFQDYYQAELKGFFTKTKAQINKDAKWIF